MKVCACTGCTSCGDRCPSLTDTTYCDGCGKAKRRASDRRRPNAARRGYDHRWQRTSAKHLRTHPLCVECGAKATDVHHLDGQGPTGPRGHDPSNLQAMCRSCHSRTTVTEQPGGWAA